MNSFITSSVILSSSIMFSLGSESDGLSQDGLSDEDGSPELLHDTNTDSSVATTNIKDINLVNIFFISKKIVCNYILPLFAMKVKIKEGKIKLKDEDSMKNLRLFC